MSESVTKPLLMSPVPPHTPCSLCLPVPILLASLAGAEINTVGSPGLSGFTGRPVGQMAAELCCVQGIAAGAPCNGPAPCTGRKGTPRLSRSEGGGRHMAPTFSGAGCQANPSLALGF